MFTWPSSNRNLQSGGSECTQENDFLGILADIDESAGTGQFGAEFTDIQIARFIGLGQS